MAVTDMYGDKRATLESLGELKVRHMLSQQTLVHHLIQPAYEWLTELDDRRREKEAMDATPKGKVGQDAIGEHQGDDPVWPSGETGGSSGLQPTAEGEGSADAGHAG